MKHRDKRPLTISPLASDLRRQALGFRLPIVLLTVFMFVVVPSFAITDANPYGAIVGRNAFALKPPTPVSNTPTTPVVLPPTIELQGITTILGRPQVLLKIKLPARPPEPAKDQSVVMDVGQREGEVEVLAIDGDAGTVRLKNQGNPISLNMTDNAAKPQAAPAVAGIPAPVLGNNPSIPNASPMSGAPAGTRPVANTTMTMGGADRGFPSSNPNTLPTRQLRGTGPGRMGSTGEAAGGFDDPVQQAAAIEVMALKNKALIESGKLAPPPHTGVKFE